MRRILLFDSACVQCSQAARAAESASNGWLKPASLHDPAVRRLLDAARPVWRWEPMLLEVGDADDSSVQVFSGSRMAARLLLGLGVRRSYEVLQAVRRGAVTTTLRRGPVDGSRSISRRQMFAAGAVLWEQRC
jgi:hypothetical protein